MDMANTTEQSDYEQEARLAKAQKLTAAFVKRGVDADTVSRLDDRGWRAWAQFAEVRIPSAQTRIMVIGMVTLEAVSA